MDGRADSWKAREICEVISDDEYTETFELARPDKPFEAYSREERKQWLARLDSEALRARVGGSKDVNCPYTALWEICPKVAFRSSIPIVLNP